MSVLSSAEVLQDSFLLMMIRKMKGEKNLPKGLSHEEDVNVSFQ